MSSSKRSRSLFSLSCGCKDSKAVSVSVSVSDTSDTKSKDLPSSAATATTTATTTTTTTTTTITTAASLSPSFYDDDAGTPSFSGLLRQLSELEKSVLAWAPPPIVEEEDAAAAGKPLSGGGGARRGRRHRRCRSEGRVEESVAVVKESEDPLADFRRSMLQMIVENEIVDGDSLRDLLRRFLQLNSRRHHDLILRAFAEIWNEVFSGYENTPDLLRRSSSSYYHYRSR